MNKEQTDQYIEMLHAIFDYHLESGDPKVAELAANRLLELEDQP